VTAVFASARQMTDGLTADERAEVFGGTATRVHRLGNG
jgi:hypothetical protein